MATITDKKKVFMSCGLCPGPDVPVCVANRTTERAAVSPDGNGHRGGERL